MNDRLHSPSWGRASITPVQRNRVLRNTFWLLALSMIPTVIGAWIGVSTGIVSGLGTGLSLMLFFGGAFGFMYAIEKTKNSAAGVPVLLGFTFFMGLMLSRILGAVLGMGNGAGIVMSAFASTAGVFGVMAVLSTVIKRDLSGMGSWLFVGALVVLFGMLANIFIGSGPMMMALSVLMTGVFSLYILYDLKRIIDGGETNYIYATLALYLDIYNVFQGFLAIFGLGGGSSD